MRKVEFCLCCVVGIELFPLWSNFAWAPRAIQKSIATVLLFFSYVNRAYRDEYVRQIIMFVSYSFKYRQAVVEVNGNNLQSLWAQMSQDIFF